MGALGQFGLTGQFRSYLFTTIYSFLFKNKYLLFGLVFGSTYHLIFIILFIFQFLYYLVLFLMPLLSLLWAIPITRTFFPYDSFLGFQPVYFLLLNRLQLHSNLFFSWVLKQVHSLFWRFPLHSLSPPENCAINNYD